MISYTAPPTLLPITLKQKPFTKETPHPPPWYPPPEFDTPSYQEPPIPPDQLQPISLQLPPYPPPMLSPSLASNRHIKLPVVSLESLQNCETDVLIAMNLEISDLCEKGWSLGKLQFVNNFFGTSPTLFTSNEKLYYLKDLLTKTLDNRFEERLLTKPTTWESETLLLPYSTSLRKINFDPYIEKAQAAIPPPLRRRLSIKVLLSPPLPIGFLFANNAFGRMNLKQKQDDEAVCHCAGRDKFKAMIDSDHIITTDPDVIKDDFPLIYDLCKKGAKFRIQTKAVTKTDFYEAIQQFQRRVERKYGKTENELLSWCQLLKSILTPILELTSRDNVLQIRKQLKKLHKKYVVTQVDKDGNGIAFVCKKVAHKLTKRLSTVLTQKWEAFFNQTHVK